MKSIFLVARDQLEDEGNIERCTAQGISHTGAAKHISGEVISWQSGTVVLDI